MEPEKQNQPSVRPEPLTSFQTTSPPDFSPQREEYLFGSGSYQTAMDAAARSYAFEPSRPRPANPAPQPVPQPVSPPPAAAPAEPEAAVPEGQGACTAAGPYSAYPPGWQSFVFQAPAAPAQTAQPSRRKARGVNGWAVAAVVLALLLGLLCGAFGYRLYAERRAAAPVQTEPPPTEARAALTPAEIYRANVDAVVSIEVSAGSGTQPSSTGTGFVISEDGEIVTNFHVVRGAASLTVRFTDGTAYPAELCCPELSDGDIALLKIEASGLQTVKLGDSERLRVGDPVCTIGNPLGDLTDSLSVGWLSAKNRTVKTDGKSIRMLQTDAAVNAGSSGGPLFNFAGEVVGVVTTKYSGETASGASVEGLGFAIPIQDVLRQLEAMKRGQYQ